MTIIKNRYTIFFELGDGYKPMFLTQQVSLDMTSNTREILDVGLSNAYAHPYLEKKSWNTSLRNILAYDIDINKYGYMNALSLLMAGTAIDVKLIQTDVTAGVITAKETGQYLTGKAIVTSISKGVVAGELATFNLSLSGKLILYSLSAGEGFPYIFPYILS